MLHGQILMVQMSPRQLTTHTDDLTIKPSKFGWVLTSNSGYMASYLLLNYRDPKNNNNNKNKTKVSSVKLHLDLSLCAKFQTLSSILSGRFWCGCSSSCSCSSCDRGKTKSTSSLKPKSEVWQKSVSTLDYRVGLIVAEPELWSTWAKIFVKLQSNFKLELTLFHPCHNNNKNIKKNSHRKKLQLN